MAKRGQGRARLLGGAAWAAVMALGTGPAQAESWLNSIKDETRTRLELADAASYPASDLAGALASLGAVYQANGGSRNESGTLAGGQPTFANETNIVVTQYDPATLALQKVQSSGGGFSLVTQAGAYGEAGLLAISSLTVNFMDHTVRADVMGAVGPKDPLGFFTVTSFQDFALATFTDADIAGSPTFGAVFGPGGLPLHEPTFSVGISNLKLTDEARGFIFQSLNLSEEGKAVLGDRFTYLGSISVVAVPEPSTYALMGLGLLGAVGVARSRRRGAAAASVVFRAP